MENKYYIPSLSEFHLGFEYEAFETALKDDFNEISPLKDMQKYSSEYLIELHANDKYWKYRKWIKKVTNKYTILDLDKYTLTTQYTPLEIKTRVRVKYLDKKDIESLGFIINIITNKDKSIAIEQFHNDEFIIGMYRDEFSNSIEWSIFNKKRQEVVFIGNIKNKSELIILLEQISITK